MNTRAASRRLEDYAKRDFFFFAQHFAAFDAFFFHILVNILINNRGLQLTN